MDPKRQSKFEGLPTQTIFEENTELFLKYKTTNLACGFPDWETPSFVVENLQKAAATPLENNYTQCSGHPVLKKVLAKEYSAIFGRELDPEKNIMVGEGGTGILFLIFFSLVQPEDEVILFEPYFQYFEFNAKMAGAKIRLTQMKPKNNKWEIDFEHLESLINEKTRLLIVNSPHNPTGKVFEDWELEKIAKMVEKYKDLIVISDEVYERCVYNNNGIASRFANQKNMWDRTITFFSAGKTFNVTGWRVGYAFGKEEFIENLVAAQRNTTFCINRTCSFSTALSIDQCSQPSNSYYKDFREKLQNSRDLLLKGFEKLSDKITAIKPDGGYFFIIDIKNLIPFIPKKYLDNVSEGYAYACFKWFAEEIGISIIPLETFYGEKVSGSYFMRVSICVKPENIEKAMIKLQKI